MRRSYTTPHPKMMAMVRELRVSLSLRQIVPPSEPGYMTGKPFTASTVRSLLGERTKVIQ
jgi:hypothetical protein